MGCQHTAQLMATVGILETEGATGVVRVARVEIGGREELTAGKFIDGEKVTEVLNDDVEEGVTEEVTAGCNVSGGEAVTNEIEAVSEGGGNTSSFLRGSRRTGLSAVPTGWPVPGNGVVLLGWGAAGAATAVGTVDAGMEHTGVWVVGGGKDAPLESGRGRVGPEAVPTGLPSPGNL